MAIHEFRGVFPDLDERDRVTQIQKRHGGEDAAEAYTFFIYADITPAINDVLRFLLTLPKGELWSIRRLAFGTEGAKFKNAFPLIRAPYYQIFSETGAALLLRSDLPIGDERSYTTGDPAGLIYYQRSEIFQPDLSEGAEIGFEVVSTTGGYVDYGRLVLHIVRVPTRETLRAKLKDERLSVRAMWERLWGGVLTRRRV